MKIGAKLKMTKAAIQQGLDGPRRRQTGTFEGHCKGERGLIRVKRDGAHRATIWHQQFWYEEL